MNLNQIFNKNNAVAFFSSMLFIGCATFVGVHSYKCFDKYFKKPEAVSVSYELNDGKAFPSFTFCSDSKETYNEKILNECQIDVKDYIVHGHWVGNGSLNCTDPKVLYNQAVIKIENFGFEKIMIKEFGPSSIRDLKDNISLNWDVTPYTGGIRKCFTFTMPKDVVSQGINRIIFYSKPFGKFQLHAKGLFWVEMFGSQAEMYYKDIVRVKLQLERIQLLQFNGEPCNDDPNYRYDECRQRYIHKVNYSKKNL